MDESAALSLDELERQSVREFLDGPVDVSVLERLLARSGDADASPPVPALYVALKGHGGLPGTLFRYDASSGRLVEPHPLANLADVFRGTPNARIADQAAFAVFLLAPADCREAVLAAGCLGQIFMTYAPGMGIGLCPVGAANADVLTAHAPLAGQGDLVYTFLGGTIAAEQVRRWAPERFDTSGEPARRWQEFARSKLPSYMVPQTFVRLDRLPLSPNGKIDRRALPSPGPIDRPAGTYTAPRTALERLLCTLWAEGLNQDRVGIHHNFFELGGHSVDAIKLVAAIQRQTGRRLPLRELFATPTIEHVAAFLERQQAEDGSGSLAVVADPERGHEPFPLTDVQHAYWLGRSPSFSLGNTSAHRYAEFDLPGLDLDRLNRACNRLIARHPTLRSVVGDDGAQRVLREVPTYAVPCLDLRGAEPEALQRTLTTIRDALSHQLLSVTDWPSFDLRATRIRDDLVRLHVSIELMNVDAYSVQILASELSDFYDQPDLDTPPLDITFRDYVVARRGLKASPAYDTARRYWLGRLETLAAPPDLPLAARPADIARPRFRRHTHRVQDDAWRRLREIAARIGVTPTGLLVAAFSAVLARWAREPAYTLNLTLFDRMPGHAQVPALVGDFTSLTLLEIHHLAGASFKDQARHIQAQLWESLEHRAFGGIEVIRELNRRRRRHEGATMPVVFTYVPPRPGAAPSGLARLLTEREGYGISQTPQVWLDNQAIEVPDGLRVNWDVVDGLFPDGLVEAMFEAYCALLRRLASGSDVTQPIDVPIPDDQARRREVVNATATPRSDDVLHGLFRRRVDAQPARPALVAGQTVLSYEHLHRLAATLAARLCDLHVERNEVVAVVMDKGWEQCAAVLGVLYAGGAYLPVNARLPALRREEILRQAEVRVVLTQPWLREDVAASGAVTVIAVTGETAATEREPVFAQRPDDLAYVIFTSGSTGRPKGVPIDHRGAVNTILDINRRFAVTEHDRVLALSSLDFDLSVFDIFGTLAAGGTIVVPDAAREREPSHWCELVRSRGVTVWNSVPALARLYVDAAASPAAGATGALRLILLSGDWIPLDLPAHLRALHPGAEIVSLGGATEASIWSIFHRVDRVDPAWRSIPYGTPLSNQTCHVLRPDLAPCPDHVVGDLYIGGLGLAQGYWRNDEATAASFVRQAHAGQRLYRTGDLARYRPDGTIELLGRTDTQVKLHGHRIELGEIEAVLAEHEEVREAAVVLQADDADHKSLLAYVTPRDAGPCEPGPETPAAGELAAIVGEVAADVASVPVVADRGELARTVDEQNARYLRGILRLLRDGRVLQSPGEKRRIADVLAQCRIAPRYERWLRRALEYLAERELLERAGEMYRSRTDLSRVDVGDDRGLDLGAVLSETLHSAELYAQDATAQAYQVYFAQCHHVARSAFTAAVRRANAGEPLAVLEVGGGLGSLTRHLLPVIERPHVTYVFTDVSRYFLQDARNAFADWPFVEYRRLDLEREPVVQGFGRHAFDIVVASSVLHVISDVRGVAQRVRSLLRPGGLLLLVEETKFFPFFDLTMGLQQGFDRFTDCDLRQAHPLLSRSQWKDVLVEADFAAVEVLSREGSFADCLGLDVIVAQAGAEGRAIDLEALRRHAEARLPRYMVPKHFYVLDAMPLSGNGKVDRRALPRGDRAAAGAGVAYAAPRDPTERRLCELWAANLEVEAVGIHDNYFELAGDSLLAVRLINRIREELGREVPLRVLFQHATVAELAGVLHELEAPATPAVAAVDRAHYLLR